MPSVKLLRGGSIAGLFVGTRKGQAKTSVAQLSLTFDGIDGDTHSGRTRKAGARKPAFRRGTTVSNNRQLSLVTIEEMNEIASRIGMSRIDPGCLRRTSPSKALDPLRSYLRGRSFARLLVPASMFLS